jgi:hypothetical protein
MKQNYRQTQRAEAVSRVADDTNHGESECEVQLLL